MTLSGWPYCGSQFKGKQPSKRSVKALLFLLIFWVIPTLILSMPSAFLAVLAVRLFLGLRILPSFLLCFFPVLILFEAQVGQRCPQGLAIVLVS